MFEKGKLRLTQELRDASTLTADKWKRQDFLITMPVCSFQ
jgi:hypothetical protein